MIATSHQRLATVIGQAIVENAQLGEMVQNLQAQVAEATARAEAAEQRLKEYEVKAAQAA